MTRPDIKIISASQAASARMADRHSPFVFNAWYVAAFGEELGDEASGALLARQILGKRVVMYRATTGEAVALEDRCPHRSFPLSAGKREGDTIVCGYHGLRFDTRGDCIEVPSQQPCPRNIGTRRYALAERGPLVWIWMGEADQADESQLPPQDWLTDAGWETSHGYLPLKASYVRLHENLLDLTHLSYLHANTFGTPDYARAKYDTEIGDGIFALQRNVVPTTLPPLWAKPTGLEGVATAARIARSVFWSPAMHEVNVRFYDSVLPEGQRPEFRIRTAHLPTPETATTTHYFVVHGRDFAQDDETMTEFMHRNLFAAFQEDVDGLALQEERLAEAGDDFFEISVAADAASVAMRRYLKQRGEREQAAREGLRVTEAANQVNVTPV